MNGLRFAALVLAGLLAGSELTSRLVVHPALWRLPHDAQVKAEKAMYRRFAFVDPFLMTVTLNMPINLAVFRWDEEHGDPERWRQLRRRWDLIHTGRVILDSTGFVLVAVAVVWH